MALLAGWSLLTPEVRGSFPVIVKIYNEHLFTDTSIQKTKMKKTRPGMAHLKNITKSIAAFYDICPCLLFPLHDPINLFIVTSSIFRERNLLLRKR